MIMRYVRPALLAFLATIALSPSGNITPDADLFTVFHSELAGISIASCALFISLTFLFAHFPVSRGSKSSVSERLTAAILSCFMIFGYSYSYCGNWSFIFGSFQQFLFAFVSSLGFYVLFRFCIHHLFGYLNRRSSESSRSFHLPFSNRMPLFWICFICLCICWLPFLLVNLPGSVPYDGYRQLNMAYNIEPISQHHPWLVTKLFGFLFSIGNNISDNFGVAMIVVFLFIAEALCYAQIVRLLHDWKAPALLWIGALAYFCLVPCFGAYAQVVMKDGLYSALFALFFTYYVGISRYLLRGGKIRTKALVLFLLLELAVSLTRNNGIYICLAADVLLFLFLAKRNRLAAFCLTVVLYCSYSFLNASLPSMLGVEEAPVREMLSVPFQQTARYLKEYPDDVTQREAEQIAAILDYENLAERYQPEISDHVKDSFRTASTDADLHGYFQAWLSMGLRHPDSYIQSTLNNTYGYFYPFHNCKALSPYQFYIQGAPIATGDFDIHYVVPEAFRNLIINYSMAWTTAPLLAQIMNPGTYTWIVLIAAAYAISRRNWHVLLLLIPAALNIGVCIVSPVNGYLRYALPLMACTPVLIFLLYLCSMRGVHLSSETSARPAKPKHYRSTKAEVHNPKQPLKPVGQPLRSSARRQAHLRKKPLHPGNLPQDINKEQKKAIV